MMINQIFADVVKAWRVSVSKKKAGGDGEGE